LLTALELFPCAGL